MPSEAQQLERSARSLQEQLRVLRDIKDHIRGQVHREDCPETGPDHLQRISEICRAKERELAAICEQIDNLFTN